MSASITVKVFFDTLPLSHAPTILYPTLTDNDIIVALSFVFVNLKGVEIVTEKTTNTEVRDYVDAYHSLFIQFFHYCLYSRKQNYEQTLKAYQLSLYQTEITLRNFLTQTLWTLIWSIPLDKTATQLLVSPVFTSIIPFCTSKKQKIDFLVDISKTLVIYKPNNNYHLQFRLVIDENIQVNNISNYDSFLKNNNDLTVDSKGKPISTVKLLYRSPFGQPSMNHSFTSDNSSITSFSTF